MLTLELHDLMLGFTVFCALFAFQALLWHFTNVTRQFLVLFSIFLIGPLPFFIFGILKPAGFFLCLLLSANYISAFPVFQASSPTLVILDLIFKKKKIAEKEIVNEMLKYGLVEDRLSDLESGALITRNQNEFKLTSKGNTLASLFIGFRSFLKLQQGEG